MKQKPQRKRAAIRIPLSIVQEAIGMPPQFDLTGVYQDHDAWVAGEIYAIVEGAMLPDEFLTDNHPVMGDANWEQTDSDIVLTIQPQAPAQEAEK